MNTTKTVKNLIVGLFITTLSAGTSFAGDAVYKIKAIYKANDAVKWEKKVGGEYVAADIKAQTKNYIAVLASDKHTPGASVITFGLGDTKKDRKARSFSFPGDELVGASGDNTWKIQIGRGMQVVGYFRPLYKGSENNQLRFSADYDKVANNSSDYAAVSAAAQKAADDVYAKLDATAALLASGKEVKNQSEFERMVSYLMRTTSHVNNVDRLKSTEVFKDNVYLNGSTRVTGLKWKSAIRNTSVVEDDIISSDELKATTKTEDLKTPIYQWIRKYLKVQELTQAKTDELKETLSAGLSQGKEYQKISVLRAGGTGFVPLADKNLLTNPTGFEKASAKFVKWTVTQYRQYQVGSETVTVPTYTFFLRNGSIYTVSPQVELD